MKQVVFSILAVFFTVSMTYGQSRVSGKVTDLAGEALIGASVVVKEAPTVGTITDIDGMYELNVPSGGSTLVFSYTGYETKEMAIGGSSVVNISLNEGKLLDEIVVTALGNVRNAREVVYSNQTVNSEDLNRNPNKNALEALRGKVAGVRITTGSGSVGASSKIVLRSEASLTGNNNALIVVDGIPIDNSSVLGGERAGEGGYADYGNRFGDINPNDIENITVLKGPAATALYGSRGASGVVLVTTKKGKSGKPKVSFNSTTSMEKAYVLLKRQDQYGQGLINPDGSTTFDSGENFSWGPKFDGVVRPWTSPIDTDGDGTYEFLSRPYSAVPDQLENFFRTGRTNINNVAIEGGNDNFTYYASYSNTFQRGILDNTDYNRNSLSFNATANLTKRLKSSFGLTYAFIDQNTALEGSRAFEGNNSYASALQSPNNIPFNELRDYKNPYHSFGGYYGTYTINPYFILNEYRNQGRINNLMGNFAISYDILKNLTWNTKIGTNVVGTNVEESTPQYAYKNHYIWEDELRLVERAGRQSSGGSYRRDNLNTRNVDLTSTLNYNTKLGSSGDYGFNALVGYNIFDRNITNNIAETRGGLIVPGIYNLANSVELARARQEDQRYRIMGFFGNLQLDWKNKIFLEYSARNDYSSTLPVDNQSFFYQGFGASAVLTELFDIQNDKVNFLKARVNYGTTGKDAGLYLLNSVFVGNPLIEDWPDIYDITLPFNNQSGFSRGNQIGNPDLKPELTTTLELGLDAGFFRDRISLDYTYFRSVHDNQIVIVSLSDASGFGNTPKNVGRIINKGHEITLGLKPFTNKNGFHWNIDFNFTSINNVVDKISDETDELVIYDSGRGVTLVAEKGKPFGTFKGTAPRFDPNGNQIVAGGLPVYSAEAQALGNIQPDWIGGFSTQIGYKNWSFNALLDTRQGNDIFSLTKFYTEFNGTASTTTIFDRKPFIIPNSVEETINPDGTATYTPNTTETLANAFIDDGNWGRNILDGSFVKLREVGLSYVFPKRYVDKIKASDLSLSLFVRNPFIWLPEENSFADPEVNGPGTAQSNISGIETTQTPPSRSFGVSLNLKY
ncbi:MAG: SusC/RagA family TonB-linked outer membrane protein [Saprospiraceae bacterium]|nr:SusC/RagA family TonB-linked outer membrane protein [Saprospiraceae bacterium]MBK8818591.1 SusC/RagA family TonB-linked outer membrane protein [Saprospiraceae bacterium]